MLSFEDDEEPEGDPEEGERDFDREKATKLNLHTPKQKCVERASESDESSDDHKYNQAAGPEEFLSFLELASVVESNLAKAAHFRAMLAL